MTVSNNKIVVSLIVPSDLKGGLAQIKRQGLQPKRRAPTKWNKLSASMKAAAIQRKARKMWYWL